jgi:MFS family permease
MSYIKTLMNNNLKRFSAFKYKNYLFYFIGQSISMIGTWMQLIAISWLVYRLTKSPFMLGLIGFTSQLPTFLFTPLCGVIADKYNRKKLMIFTQVFAMVQSLILVILYYTNHLTVWYVIILGILYGCVNALDVPIRHAFVVDMIEDKEDLSNAIALNSVIVNGSRLIGPAIAGIIIAMSNEGVCLTINTLSFIAVIIALFIMKINKKDVHKINETKIIHDLLEGFNYVIKHKSIRYVLLLLAIISLIGIPYMVLLPVFVKEIFRGGSHTLGFLMSTTGIGALTGGLYLANKKGIPIMTKHIIFGSLFFGLSLIGFAFSKNIYLAIFMIFIIGFTMMMQVNCSNMILQEILEDDKRGRVMSFYTMAFMGMAPFGSLLAGSLSSIITAPYTLALGGLFCVIFTMIFAKRLLSLK